VTKEPRFYVEAKVPEEGEWRPWIKATLPAKNAVAMLRRLRTKHGPAVDFRMREAT
jgi:hypothetical protein